VPEPIVYQFRPEGHGDVVSAIRSISAAALDAGRAQDTFGRSAGAAGREAARSATTTRRDLSDVEQLARRVAAEQERAAKRASAAQERAARDAVAAANRSGQAQVRAHEQAAKAAERASQRAAAATKRAEAQRWAEVERTAARIRREMDREAAHAERVAEQKARAEQRARDRFLKNPSHAIPGLAWAAGGAIVGLAGSAFSTGIGLVGGAVRESMETQAIANRVSINARMAGQEGADPTQLRKEFERAAVATPGQSAGDIGKAVQKYVDLTGDLETARKNMQLFATTASATGATVEDVATTAASLGQKFNVKSVEDMRQVMAGLTMQGKGGAMTMADLAAQFQKLASAGAAFDIGKGPEAVARLGGLVQIARTGTRSPQQAGTAVENVFSALTAHAGDLKSGKYGGKVNVFNKAGGKRDVDEILAETVANVGGSNLEKKNAGLLKIFGKQGVRAINPLISAYTDAAAGHTGKDAQKAGYEAVIGALKKATQAASDFAEVERDAAQAQAEAGAVLSGAWEKIKAAVGDRLAPKIAEIVERLAGDPAVFEMFATAIGIAADALEALAAKLEELNLITGKSPEEKASAAQLKSESYQKQLNAIGGGAAYNKLSDEDQAKYNAINAKKLKADELVESSKRAGEDQRRLEAFQKDQEEIGIRTAGKGTREGLGPTPEQQANERAFKRGEGKWARKAGVEDYGGVSAPGLTDAQREGRRAMMGNTGGDHNAAAGAAEQKAAAEMHKSAAKELHGAARALAAAAKPSITGSPVTPGAKH
jgi:hypothetical protein